MAFKNRYLIMKNMDDDSYKDILTFPLEKFEYNYPISKYKLSEVDIKRFDLFIYKKYGKSDYRDLILFLNNIDYVRNLEVGQIITLPDVNDLESFYNKNILTGEYD